MEFSPEAFQSDNEGLPQKLHRVFWDPDEDTSFDRSPCDDLTPSWMVPTVRPQHMIAVPPPLLEQIFLPEFMGNELGPSAVLPCSLPRPVFAVPYVFPLLNVPVLPAMPCVPPKEFEKTQGEEESSSSMTTVSVPAILPGLKKPIFKIEKVTKRTSGKRTRKNKAAAEAQRREKVIKYLSKRGRRLRDRPRKYTSGDSVPLSLLQSADSGRTDLSISLTSPCVNSNGLKL